MFERNGRFYIWKIYAQSISFKVKKMWLGIIQGVNDVFGKSEILVRLQKPYFAIIVKKVLNQIILCNLQTWILFLIKLNNGQN